MRLQTGTSGMSDHRILPATPKKSTTSYCTTGSGGITPERSDDAAKRRELQARLNAPTPREVAVNSWLEYERSWERRIKESDERQRNEMRERIRRDEQAAKDAAARQDKIRQYKTNELLVEQALSILTQKEKAAAYQRLVNEGRVTEPERATVLAMTIAGERKE
jgi:hypothetical protein